MKIRYILPFLVLLLALNAQGWCAGTTSAAFLKLGIGARNVAMGETGAAGTDIHSLYWNPAGLNGIRYHELSFMHAQWFDNIQFENVSYVQRLSKTVIGISVDYVAVPPIEKTDFTGALLNETFAPSDMAVSLAFARTEQDVPYGIAIKYISSTIDTVSAQTAAVTFGVLLHRALASDIEGLKLGLAIQNMGLPMKYEQKACSLPLNVKLGASYLVTRDCLLACDMNKGIDTDIILNFGSEYLFRFEERISLAVRAGYRSNTRGQGGLAGLTSGLGISYDGWSLDYALLPYGDLDMTQRISLLLKFK